MLYKQISKYMSNTTNNHTNNTTNNIIHELQNYMFTSKNIIRFTKQLHQTDYSTHLNGLFNTNKHINNTQTQKKYIDSNQLSNKQTNTKEQRKTKQPLNKQPTNKKETNKKETNNLYTPIQTDSLFWCFYILKYGFSNYEMEITGQYFSVEKTEKFKYIELLRKNKHLLKVHKVKPFTEIEDDLANQSRISIKTFFSLCIIENMNVLLVDNRKIYEVLCCDIDDTHPLHIIHRNNKTYEHSIEFDLSGDSIQKYRDTYYKVNNFDDVLKAMSSYKSDELLELCSKLKINIDTINTTNKKKPTKKDIYELLVLNY